MSELSAPGSLGEQLFLLPYLYTTHAALKLPCQSEAVVAVLIRWVNGASCSAAAEFDSVTP